MVGLDEDGPISIIILISDRGRRSYRGEHCDGSRDHVGVFGAVGYAKGTGSKMRK